MPLKVASAAATAASSEHQDAPTNRRPYTPRSCQRMTFFVAWKTYARHIVENPRLQEIQRVLAIRVQPSRRQAGVSTMDPLIRCCLLIAVPNFMDFQCLAAASCDRFSAAQSGFKLLCVICHARRLKPSGCDTEPSQSLDAEPTRKIGKISRVLRRTPVPSGATIGGRFYRSSHRDPEEGSSDDKRFPRHPT